MRIGLITPRPDHPLLAAATALLTPRHQVVAVDPDGWQGGDDPAQEPSVVPLAVPSADVYLLKARTPRALALGRALEARGAPVLNSPTATARCQDRLEMAGLARNAGLPFAETWTLGGPATAAELPRPLVVKSRHSRRHDLVARVDDAARLRELRAAWPEEPLVAQEFTPNSGWDHKLWVIDGRVFAALRRSELARGGRGPTLPLAPGDLPGGWLGLVRTVGSVFALDVYGVDVIDAGGGAPLIVDINAFPGIRGQAGAPEALAALALRAGSHSPSGDL
ncbi:RimK family alpha-L-glutamate ligase [Streptomyces sp. NPDC051569]|uniref:RimK family alpha-L-glutamate ligase n=1 Tax=Streptomyces sp. NPDC051569 TaxID=3365661 RepID=UPI0037AED979